VKLRIVIKYYLNIIQFEEHLLRVSIIIGFRQANVVFEKGGVAEDGFLADKNRLGILVNNHITVAYFLSGALLSIYTYF
jgi:hypothetical protein